MDEEIEILEEEVNSFSTTAAIPNPIVDGHEVPLSRSSASDNTANSNSSAPPGFLEKGKFSHMLNSFQEHEDFSASSATETWKEFFESRNDDALQFQVPKEWAHFIASQLLSPDKFDWICKFLQSQMWNIIVDGTSHEDLMTIFIPDKCPSSQPLTCIDSDTHLNIPSNDILAPSKFFCTSQGKPTNAPDNGAHLASSTSALHAKGKRKDRAPLVESEVRRSSRLSCQAQGFKQKTC